MESHLYKSSGIALSSGALLIIATMVLHPAGGSIEHILSIYQTITATHALAIFSLPILYFGFYGLSKHLKDRWNFAQLALFIMGFGLIAALFAAVLNGLALPYFLDGYKHSLAANRTPLTFITNYGFALNKALDYLFIAATCLSMGIYSILMLTAKKLRQWIGYLGISLVLFAIVGVFFEVSFTNLLGFQIFIFGIATWFLATGLALFTKK